MKHYNSLIFIAFTMLITMLCNTPLAVQAKESSSTSSGSAFVETTETPVATGDHVFIKSDKAALYKDDSGSAITGYAKLGQTFTVTETGDKYDEISVSDSTAYISKTDIQKSNIITDEKDLTTMDMDSSSADLESVLPSSHFFNTFTDKAAQALVAFSGAADSNERYITLKDTSSIIFPDGSITALKSNSHNISFQLANRSNLKKYILKITYPTTYLDKCNWGFTFDGSKIVFSDPSTCSASFEIEINGKFTAEQDGQIVKGTNFSNGTTTIITKGRRPINLYSANEKNNNQKSSSVIPEKSAVTSLNSVSSSTLTTPLGVAFFIVVVIALLASLIVVATRKKH